MTLDQIGKAVGVQLTTVWRWEHGKTKPDHAHVVRLADVTGVHLLWLSTGNGPMRRRNARTTTRVLDIDTPVACASDDAAAPRVRRLA